MSTQSPINILIVDDEPKNLMVVETVLDDPGYRLVRADSADKALLALVAEEFAVLILDIRMPEMTGFELAQIIKKRTKTSRVPIIFLTAYYNEDQHVLEGYGVGAVDYLHKPVNAAVLRSKVAVFAELHRKERALVMEVTERRRAEERLRELNETLDHRVAERTAELRESEARLSAILHNTPALIYELDTESRFVHVNRHFEQMFKVNADDVRGRSVFEVLPGEIAARFDASNREVLKGNVAVELEETTPHANGIRTYISVRVPRVASDGQPAGIVGISIDITERKKAEAALAGESHRKDEFLAMLSHELRNPLAPIRAAVHVMKARANGSEHAAARQARDIIERQVGNLTKLVGDLLEVSRVVSGRIRLERRIVDLNKIVAAAIESTMPLIEQHKHELVSHLCEDGVWADADATRMEEVFINLFNNAAKYTPEGGRIEVWCERMKGHSDEKFAQFRIRDSGVGIDRELLPRIFDLFTQADRSLARAQGGLGIGLSLAHQLVGMHGGVIIAASDGPGQGAEFIVKLPLMARPADLPVAGDLPGKSDEAAGTATAGTATAGTATSGQAKSIREGVNGTPMAELRVLVVDDNVDYVAMLDATLRQLGYAVRTAHSGSEALEIAQEWRPDVVLLDIGLPGLDGYEVARRLRAHGDTRHAKLIAVTGYGREVDKAQARLAGFDEHLTKPVEVADILKLLAAPIMTA